MIGAEVKLRYQGFPLPTRIAELLRLIEKREAIKEQQEKAGDRGAGEG